MPGQAILFARGAHNALGVLVHLVTFVLLERIFVLRFHVAAANVNGVQFIATDAPVEELLAAGFSIEVPLASQFYERHGKGPVLVAHEEECPNALLWIDGNAFLLARFGSEVRGALTVLRVFTGKKDIVATRTKNLFENALIEFLGRIN